MLGTLNHHDTWVYADDDSLPGFGVTTGAGGILGAGYLVHRRMSKNEQSVN